MKDAPRWRELVRPHPAWLGVGAAIGLAWLGIAAMGQAHPDYAAAQLRWLFVGVGALGVCALPHPRIVGLTAFPLMVLITVLLLIMVLPGVPQSVVPVRNGTRAWIDLHFMMFQPSEVAKIIFVLALARYLRHKQNYRTLRGLLKPFAIMFVPVILILKQPDLGTAILFPVALFAVLVAAGARLKHLGTLAGLAVLAIALSVISIYTLPESMQLLRPHQRARIIAMISQARGDTRYIEDKGYQQFKAMTLVGAGELTGYGAERSATIVGHNKLPEDHNDMIFAVIANRWGLRGAMGTLALYTVLIGSFLWTAARTKDPFARLSIVGFAGLLFMQMTINIGMSIGLLPIIGITLPFVSYGGSSLVATFLMVGLVLNFAAQQKAMIMRPSFEFHNKAIQHGAAHALRRA